MSVFGKSHNITVDNLLVAADRCDITARHAKKIIDEV
jgi:hypothetical protein